MRPFLDAVPDQGEVLIYAFKLSTEAWVGKTMSEIDKLVVNPI